MNILLRRTHRIVRQIYESRTYVFISLSLTLIVFCIYVSQLYGYEYTLFTRINIIAAVLFTFEIFLEHFGDKKEHSNFKKYFYIALEIIVVLSLLPIFPDSLLFLGSLRILRTLTLYHKFIIKNGYFARYGNLIANFTYLLLFIFIVSSSVFYLKAEGENINSFTDAIYFTVSTVSTTGYGDITPITPATKLISAVIMLFGITLFLRLAASLSYVNKKYKRCEYCNLSYHDNDAIYCKQCGTTLARINRKR